MNLKIIIVAIISLLIGSVITYFVLPGSAGTGSVEINEDEGKQLYTCGMHPEIIQEEPGNCPICGMKLTPVKNSNSTASGEKKILYWRAPMDPNEIYDSPGKSKMGMDLVPVYDSEGGASGVVTIDPVVQQNMNIKIEPVEIKTLSTEVVTNGILKTDERNEVIITTKAGGWIDKLYINFTGQKVREGEKLVDIYSPELIAAEQEFITALDYSKSVSGSSDSDILNSGNELVKNAMRKLELLDLSSKDIETLRRNREVKKYITLYAPSNGTVIHKNIIEGQKIMPGMPLMKISDLNKLWLIADIYEYELSKIKVGSRAEVKYNFLPGKVFNEKVSFIFPTLDAKTRTVKVRFDIGNMSDMLKPDMFANVVLTGNILRGKPVIPEEAVLRSGRKNIIILALGEGKFKPKEVQLGEYAHGYYQVLEGVNEGNKIVTSAQFLIDSESSLRSAIKQFQPPVLDDQEAVKSESGVKNMKMDTDSHSHSDTDMKDESAKQETIDEDHSMQMNDNDEEAESIVREGVIDVETIDKNKDGKVFQDFMDWNVISDEPGRCPVCEMKLREVTVETAKENLVKNGFQHK